MSVVAAAAASSPPSSLPTPHIRVTKADKDTMLYFTLSNTNVSIANSLRRIILSSIPCAVIKSVQIKTNVNTGLTNEILAHRLSATPVHIELIDAAQLRHKSIYDDISNGTIEVELSVKNDKMTTAVVTSGDLKIRKRQPATDQYKYMDAERVKIVFPANERTGHYIELVHLSPQLSAEFPGGHVELVGVLGVGTAADDGCYAAACTCSYGYTIDGNAQQKALSIQLDKWREDKTADIEFETQNWLALEGKRYTVPDSFDFVIETVSAYSNAKLAIIACYQMIVKLEALIARELRIEAALTTMANAFDVYLDGEDHTVGKVIEYAMYTLYFNASAATTALPNQLTFCAFLKKHPHDPYVMIRLAYANPDASANLVVQQLTQCVHHLIHVYRQLITQFQSLSL